MLSPKKVVLIDNSEYNLYDIHLELVGKGSDIDVIPSLCTVTNYHQLKQIIEKNKFRLYIMRQLINMFQWLK